MYVVSHIFALTLATMGRLCNFFPWGTGIQSLAQVGPELSIFSFSLQSEGSPMLSCLAHASFFRALQIVAIPLP